MAKPKTDSGRELDLKEIVWRMGQGIPMNVDLDMGQATAYSQHTAHSNDVDLFAGTPFEKPKPEAVDPRTLVAEKRPETPEVVTKAPTTGMAEEEVREREANDRRLRKRGRASYILGGREGFGTPSTARKELLGG